MAVLEQLVVGVVLKLDCILGDAALKLHKGFLQFLYEAGALLRIIQTLLKSVLAL